MKLNYQPSFWNFAQTRFLNQFDQIPTSLLNWKSSSEYQSLFDLWGTSLRQRVTVQRAPLAWANETCRRYHYLKAGVSGYAHPMSFSIAVDHILAGVVIVGTPFARRLKGVYGYSGLISSWEVLVLNRFWLCRSFKIEPSPIPKGVRIPKRSPRARWQNY